jgi:polysaccharide chain length determinant protein (PEP-CTERM system associated)
MDVLLGMAWRRKWTFLACALVVTAAGIAVVSSLPNRYRADTLILVVPQRVPESYVRSAITARFKERLDSISQRILGRVELERIIYDLNLYQDLRQKQAIQEVVLLMRKRDITLDLVKGDAFRLGYANEDPETAVKVTRRLAALFIDESLRDRATLSEGMDAFLEAQLDEARTNLVDNEKRLEAYRRQHNGELPTQLNANVEALHNTQLQLQALLDSVNRDRDRHLVLDRSMAEANLSEVLAAAAPAALGTDPDGQPKVPAAERLKAAEAALHALELRLTPKHPDVIQMRETVAELRRSAEAETARSPVTTTTPAEALRRNRVEDLRTELESLDRQIEHKTQEETRLRGLIADYQRRIAAEPTREAELAGLTRDYETLQATYRNLLAKKQESKVAANLERREIAEQFRVIEPAEVPQIPFSPNRPMLNGVAALSGVLVGLALIAFLEYRDNAMRSEDDVKACLGVTVLATMPRVRPQARWWQRRSTVTTLTEHTGGSSVNGNGSGHYEFARGAAAPERLVLGTNADAMLVEQNLRLAAALRQAQLENGAHSVMIASAVENEGKTLTATNLALTLSHSHKKRVLIVDADLRRPAIHAMFQIENAVGLSDVLKRTSPNGHLPLHQISPTLWVMPAGPPNADPMSVPVADNLKHFLADAAKQFDWIVVDTSPVAFLPDANLMASVVDTTVMVVSADTTPYPLVTRATAALGLTRVLGVVLNRAASSAADVGYGYYSYSYTRAETNGRRRRLGRWGKSKE